MRLTHWSRVANVHGLMVDVHCLGRCPLYVGSRASFAVTLRHGICIVQHTLPIGETVARHCHELWTDELEAVPRSLVQSSWYCQLHSCSPMIVCSSVGSAHPVLFTYIAQCVGSAMVEAAATYLNTYVRGGPPRSRDVTLTLEHDYFQMLCRRNKKPSATSVKRWWAVVKRPLDDTNVYSIMHLVRRALLDWPKMGASIAKMAEKEFVLARKEKLRRKRVEAQAARKLKKQRALEGMQNGIAVGSARTQSSVKKCHVKKASH